MPAGDRPVVVDTTPIIALSLVDHLDLYVGTRLVEEALRLAGE